MLVFRFGTNATVETPTVRMASVQSQNVTYRVGRTPLKCVVGTAATQSTPRCAPNRIARRALPMIAPVLFVSKDS